MPTTLSRRGFLARSATTLMALAGPVPSPLASSGVSPRARPRGRSPALIAFRISNEQWSDPARFRALLDFFRRRPGTADELALFTSSTHPPLPVGEIRRRCERMAEILPQIRAEGMGAGINLLATMGHHEENLDGSLSAPWQRVADPQGRVSQGSFCPAGEEFLGYVVEVYTELARIGPDFLWIDDDIRLAGHMPVGQTCFCEGCLRRFSIRTGRKFTRETLSTAFRSGSLEDRMALRRQWLEHNRATLDHLFAVIERTVHGVAPGLALGFMTGDRFFEGYAFERWANTLAGPSATSAAVRWRPGGGFYSDETLPGMVGKAHDIGRQVSQLPSSVEVIQSEIENFPYDLLRKASQTTVVEAAAHLAAGCSGAAFNVLSQRPDPLEEYEPLLDRIHATRPFYERLRRELGRSPVLGAWPAWNRDLAAANAPDGAWPDGAGDAIAALARSYVLGEIGIPLCYGPSGAAMTVLAGNTPLAFGLAELRRILSGGVLMDVAAWKALERLGLAETTGVQLGEVRARDAIEVLTEHPLNGRFAGRSRDCRQSFWHEPAQALELADTGALPLARMIDYLGRDLGVAMSAYVNRDGGRVVVMGYFPWSQMHHLAKSSQMKSVCAWLASGRLPVMAQSFTRLHLWVRRPSPDRLACVVLNGSLDPAKAPVLRVAAGLGDFQWCDFHGRRSRPRAAEETEVDGLRFQRLVLPAMGPWDIGLLVASGNGGR